MAEFAVVIPVAPNREENLRAVLECVVKQTKQPKLVVLVCDGEDAWRPADAQYSLPTVVLNAPKHKPGMEQPRNLGVRAARKLMKDRPTEFSFSHVAFLDSDVIFEDDLLEKYAQAIDDTAATILYGPYEWLPAGKREIDHSFFNDPRWPMFREHNPGVTYYEDLSKGLGCFSGNLVWNVAEFERVGGFWSEIHHGRCEDGELGLRAVAMGVGITLVPEARGWHLHHPRNNAWILAANSRDVPLINERHPWVQGKGLFVVDEDGKRFDATCDLCGWKGNTALIWSHRTECEEAKATA